MPVIFLSENNSLSKKVIKSPLPQEKCALLAIPFKKLRKRAVADLRKRLENSGSLVFADPALSILCPIKEPDIKLFFNSFIIDFLYRIIKQKKFTENRLVIFDPTEALVLSAINLFPDLALAGENTLSVSNSIYKLTGASIPLVSGSKYSDIVLCTKDHATSPACLLSGYDIEPGKNSISGNSLKFYPEGDYSSILSISHRPLTIKEAAALSEYDNKATFNIVF